MHSILYMILSKRVTLTTKLFYKCLATQTKE